MPMISCNHYSPRHASDSGIASRSTDRIEIYLDAAHRQSIHFWISVGEAADTARDLWYSDRALCLSRLTFCGEQYHVELQQLSGSGYIYKGTGRRAAESFFRSIAANVRDMHRGGQSVHGEGIFRQAGRSPRFLCPTPDRRTARALKGCQGCHGS